MSENSYRVSFSDKKITNFGAVVVFREDVTQEEAEKALKKIEHLLSYKPTIHGFDSDWGGPVWYIP